MSARTTRRIFYPELARHASDLSRRLTLSRLVTLHRLENLFHFRQQRVDAFHDPVLDNKHGIGGKVQ